MVRELREREIIIWEPGSDAVAWGPVVDLGVLLERLGYRFGDGECEDQIVSCATSSSEASILCKGK